MIKRNKKVRGKQLNKTLQLNKNKKGKGKEKDLG